MVQGQGVAVEDVHVCGVQGYGDHVVHVVGVDPVVGGLIDVIGHTWGICSSGGSCSCFAIAPVEDVRGARTSSVAVAPCAAAASARSLASRLRLRRAISSRSF